MNDPEEAIDFYRIQASVGSMLSLWASVERSLEDNIQKLAAADSQKKPHETSQKVEIWKNLATSQLPNDGVHQALCNKLASSLRQSLTIRNMICHGLRGAMAGTRSTATLATRLEGIERKFTWNELQSMFSFLARAPRAIDLLSSAKERAGRAGMPTHNEWLPEWSDDAVGDTKT
jgi:hypothetical protein